MPANLYSISFFLLGFGFIVGSILECLISSSAGHKWYNRDMTTAELQLPIELQELRAILKKHGVIKASVFGSYARGEASANSDLDLLVELKKGRSLFDLGGLQFELDQRLSGGVDIATKLNRHFEPYITPDLVEIL
jgi:hypothetical protein